MSITIDILPMILGRYEKGSLAIPEAVAGKVRGMVEPAAPAAKKTRKTKKATEAKAAEKPTEKPAEEKEATADEPEVKKPVEKKPSKSRKKKTSPALIIESLLGGTITLEEIISRIPADVDTVYIKPEENKAYWVRGDESGSVELW